MAIPLLALTQLGEAVLHDVDAIEERDLARAVLPLVERDEGRVGGESELRGVEAPDLAGAEPPAAECDYEQALFDRLRYAESSP
ncbi:hypothetical protein [Halarchaeum nitratireducens]|uniref:Uncharacterized protein n=1 Tax=Halarchaeum nitratireducens TaxID=489913 RepID=A0A830GGR1_9EURY|nr:hypothetical protein [Halarchaeum nitratireducens]GGN25147.1 hypothetical protein GCM10009021_28790 [Halarchaeum nitratireducens]